MSALKEFLLDDILLFKKYKNEKGLNLTDFNTASSKKYCISVSKIKIHKRSKALLSTCKKLQKQVLSVIRVFPFLVC